VVLASKTNWAVHLCGSKKYFWKRTNIMNNSHNIQPIISRALIIIIIIAMVSPCIAKPLIVNVDLAQYKYDELTNYAELYYSFNESQLDYIRKNGSLSGALRLQVKLFSITSDSLTFNHSWRIPHSTADTMVHDGNKTVVGAISFTIPKIKQKLVIDISDEVSGRSNSIKSIIEPKKFPAGQIALSDVELCLTITQNPINPIPSLYKNTYEAKPRPSRQILTTHPHFYYYLEAYNLLPAKTPEIYTIRTMMIGTDGQEYLHKAQKKKYSNDSSVEVGYSNLSTLPLGKYEFVFYLEDADNKLLSQTSKSFIYTDPGNLAFQLAGDLIMQALSNFDTAMVDQEFDYLEYLAKPSEITAYNELTSIHQKKYYLVEFWNKKKPVQIEPHIFRNEYLNRIKNANSRFSVGDQKGWTTDRGRVLIIYGLPNDIEQFKSGIDIKPYETWYYHKMQGGVLFVFADLTGFNNYVLLHSTHRNELSNNNWKDYLTK
ncbi:MAG: GWxTD domain-containing protein, partial [Candidatus Marinimicrobia bacterium]|nr:GWxTD domain-containing protein [Candidatus Neomarinimicrobiota bacterium]